MKHGLSIVDKDDNIMRHKALQYGTRKATVLKMKYNSQTVPLNIDIMTILL